MMKLKKQKGPYETEAFTFDRGKRKIIISLDPNYVIVRAKKKRDNYKLPWQTIYTLAVKNSIEK